jgi:hypothetical protein
MCNTIEYVHIRQIFTSLYQYEVVLSTLLSNNEVIKVQKLCIRFYLT